MQSLKYLRLVPALIVVAACSSGAGTSAGVTATSMPPTPAAVTAEPVASSPPAASPSSVEETNEPTQSASGEVGHGHPVAVSIEDFEFKPPVIEAAVGQTIEWSNMDGEPHTVRAADGRFSSAIIVGEPFEWTVTGSAGTDVPYICSIHPAMTGLVTIAGD